MSAPIMLPNVSMLQVYVPLKYESKHWILAEIDIIARKIIVYDSEENFIGQKFKKFMEPLSTLLPLLLHQIDFFSKRPELDHREDTMSCQLSVVQMCRNRKKVTAKFLSSSLWSIWYTVNPQTRSKPKKHNISDIKYV